LHDIDAVLQPSGYDFKMLNKASINPIEMIDRCGKKVVKINTLELEKKPVAIKPQIVKETKQEPILAEEYV
jgi:hypothetical protein